MERSLHKWDLKIHEKLGKFEAILWGLKRKLIIYINFRK